MKWLGILLVFLTFFQEDSFGQKENNHWFFGSRAGVSFSGDTPQATEGRLITIEGTSVASDTSGNLLFYTDGSTVWDSVHNPMPNGTGLLGDESTTQSSLVVPLPDSDTLFYVFTLSRESSTDGFNYSIVDMSKNSGQGDVVSKNNFLLDSISEKIAALHKDNAGFWVVVHRSEAYYAYPLTRCGIGIPVISRVGMKITVGDKRGEMKFSPDGKKLAAAHIGLGAEVFDFDKNTGIVSNPVVLVNGERRYGVCFSPDNTKLYMSNNAGFPEDYIVQYDMTAPDIAASETLIASSTKWDDFGALQLAPDGKIYMARFGEEFLSVINEPNRLGAQCNYLDTGLLLLRTCGLGLPNFASYLYSYVPEVHEVLICENGSVVLDAGHPGANFLWSTGETSQEITVSDSGTYFVEIDDKGCFYADTFLVRSDTVTLQSVNDSTVLCVGQTLLLDATTYGSTYLWQDASTNPTYAVIQDGTYWVEVQNACGIYSDTVSIEFEECNCFYVPNTFSPNGDGVNDAFLPILGCELTDYEMVVFNRWGEIIFESSNANTAWDGTYKGEDLPQGVYVYRIVYKEIGAEVMSVKEHGKVVLIR